MANSDTNLDLPNGSDTTQTGATMISLYNAALNFLHGKIGTLSDKIGTLANLTTEAKTSIVAAINDLQGKITILDNATNDTGWITPTLSNNYERYSEVYNNVGYRKIGKQVFLKGFVKCKVASNEAYFTLPEGFRPTNYLQVLNTAQGPSYYHMNILTDGQVKPTNSTTVNSWYSIDNVSFFVD